MNADTIKLLRECNAGIKMGESSIKKTLPHAKDPELKRTLEVCKNTHADLGDRTHKLLLEAGAETKDPHPIASMMSDMKIKMAMMMKDTDQSIASIMTDGCNMGIKSLSRYLNQYKNASRESKEIAERLIASEEYLETNIRGFL